MLPVIWLKALTGKFAMTLACAVMRWQKHWNTETHFLKKGNTLKQSWTQSPLASPLLSIELAASRKNIQSFWHAHDGNKLSNQSPEAVDGRKKLRQLKKERQSTDIKRKSLDKSSKHVEQQMTELQDWIDGQKGQFERSFDNVMDSLNLKRQIYHSRALIGKDIDTAFAKGNNIQKIASVFQKQTLNLKCGNEKHYGSSELVQKVYTMLSKYAQIHHLMASLRPLCKHGVEFLKVRCISFGNWFPCNFPSLTLKRKFHIIT